MVWANATSCDVIRSPSEFPVPYVWPQQTPAASGHDHTAGVEGVVTHFISSPSWIGMSLTHSIIFCLSVEKRGLCGTNTELSEERSVNYNDVCVWESACSLRPCVLSGVIIGICRRPAHALRPQALLF